MRKVKVKSPYGSPRQRGVEITLYEDKYDACSGRWSGILYSDADIRKLRTIRITNPHIGQWARETNFLVLHEGKWCHGTFNGTYFSWEEN